MDRGGGMDKGLTDEQLGEIAAEIYAACHQALGKRKDEISADDEHPVKSILDAYDAAKKVRRAAAKKHSISRHDLPSIWDYLASAYWLWASDIDDLELSEVVPGCAGSAPFLNFARAFAMVQSMRQFESLRINDHDYVEGIEAVQAVLQTREIYD